MNRYMEYAVKKFEEQFRISIIKELSFMRVNCWYGTGYLAKVSYHNLDGTDILWFDGHTRTWVFANQEQPINIMEF